MVYVSEGACNLRDTYDAVRRVITRSDKFEHAWSRSTKTFGKRNNGYGLSLALSLAFSPSFLSLTCSHVPAPPRAATQCPHSDALRSLSLSLPRSLTRSIFRARTSSRPESSPHSEALLTKLAFFLSSVSVSVARVARPGPCSVRHTNSHSPESLRRWALVPKSPSARPARTIATLRMTLARTLSLTLHPLVHPAIVSS